MTSRDRSTFYRSAWMLYGLASLFPYLIGVYLILNLNIDITYTLINVLGLTLVLMLLGALMIHAFANRLRSLVSQVSRSISGGKTEKIETRERDFEEVYLLASDFNAIVEDLDQHKKHSKKVTAKMLGYISDLDDYEKRSRKESLIRDNLSRYVSQDVVDELIRSGMASFENVECTATILFADIRAFTTLSEKLTPGEIINLLNDYFGKMVPIIFEHGGTLDKFVGDELMAMFRDSPYGDRAPLRAVKAAIEMLAAVEELKKNANKNYSQLAVGIGINTGKVVIGNVGSEHRKDYTAIGDTVNVAARFEQIASRQEIIIGEQTYQVCKDYLVVEETGEIILRNRKAPVRGFKVIKTLPSV